MTRVTSTPVVARRTASLVVTPAIVAHRGASGYRPEHTLDAYRLAIAMGADDIEVDLVPTRDGVLVARHESELSGTTDIAERPEFADRHTTKVVDGSTLTGWFTHDLTLAELKTLGAWERLPGTRPANAAYDGQAGIPTFNEILAMVRAESTRHGRTVGVMAELKQASYFDSVGLALDAPLLADLRRHEVDHCRSRITVMSFETAILRRLAGRLRVPVLQLMGAADTRAADLVAVGDLRTYADLATPEGLASIDEYADGIGVHRTLVLPRDPEGAIGMPSHLVRDAHRQWLTVYVWTLRAENRYLPTNLRLGADPDGLGELAAEARAFLDAGVDGLVTDHPDLLLDVR